MDGPGLIEYGLVLLLAIIVIAGVVIIFGGMVGNADPTVLGDCLKDTGQFMQCLAQQG